MVRHPHSVTVSWKAPVKDETSGNYSAGAEDSFTADCSVSNNTKGQKIGTDGKMVDYSITVHMEKQSKEAPYGASAVVTFEGGTTFSGTVKRMFNYQTYSKIWL
jgi:hypothetical protein